MSIRYKVNKRSTKFPFSGFTILVLSSIILLLLFNVSAANAQSLTEAVGKNDSAKVVNLISQGADVNMADKGGNTPLMLAARWGYISIVKILLDHNALPDKVRSVKGRTCLMIACAYYSSMEICKMLVDKGADVNATANDGTTSLMLAAQFSKVEIVNYLLSKGANASLKDNTGKTAQDYARSADLSIFGSAGLKGIKLDKEGRIQLLEKAGK